jgi:SNF2 family DNA or RNA helicase
MDSYEFKFTPYKHQMTALDMSKNKDNFALFCEMGTGKSKILIDTMCMLRDRGDINGALIVAPKGVYKNWERSELPTHMPDRYVDTTDLVAWSPKETKAQLAALSVLLKKDGRFKILVMNVEAFSTVKGTEFATKFMKANKCLMAVDESTTIKNRTAKRTKNIVKVGDLAEYRRILTGSPVTKSPMDLYSQCAFLDPKLIGFNSFFAFQARYAKMVRRTMGAHSFNQIVGYQNLEELSTRLNNFSYRVLKKDCLDLPEKVYIKRTVELGPEQAVLYRQMKDMSIALLQNKGMVTAQNVLTQLLRLQQICSGFIKNDNGETVDVPTNKMDELLAVIDEVDGKVVIWSIFVKDILKITEMLNDAFGAGSAEAFYGDTPADERQDIVERFQQPNSKLRFFVGNPRIGGRGLTLTEAKTMVFYNNLYDLEIRLQAEDRAHRIGQKKNVTYIDIVAEGTVDEKILKALRDKIDVATLILKEEYKDWLI